MSRLSPALALAAALGCAVGGDAGTSPFAESSPPPKTTGGDDDSGDPNEGDGSSSAPPGDSAGGSSTGGAGGSASAGSSTSGSTGGAMPACGDGHLDAGEACDDGNLVDTDTCTAACQPAACGDGHVQPGEQCDDGNLDPGDGCEPGCALPSCGDGKVQAGEQCDDGNQIDTDACTSACKTPICGDGHVQAGEQCDDGNGVATDACVNCKPAVCGDGSVFQGAEECDDGNATATDACVNCKAAKCGDGVVWAGVEACDGGPLLHGQCAGCKVACDGGWGDCDKLPQTGCEVELATTPAHCGACGKACGPDQTCLAGKCVGEYGPSHSFVGYVSDLYVTQGCCSVNCQGNPATDAAYFCTHFYGPGCAPKPGYAFVAGQPNAPKMHKYGGCSNLGLDIPGTQCDGGPCKMLTVPAQANGLTNLVCQCP